MVSPAATKIPLLVPAEKKFPACRPSEPSPAAPDNSPALRAGRPYRENLQSTSRRGASTIARGPPPKSSRDAQTPAPAIPVPRTPQLVLGYSTDDRRPELHA